MRRLAWIAIGGLLLVGAVYWARSRQESALRTAQIHQEVESLRGLPKRLTKISIQQDDQARHGFPFAGKVAELMEPAGFVVIDKCKTPCDSVLDIHVTVDVREGQYISEGTLEVSTRYTGASLSGNLGLRTSNGGRFSKSFAGDKPLQTVIRGGYKNPSDAPIFEIFWEHVVPSIADLLGEAYGPEPLIRALRTTGDEEIRYVHSQALARMGRRAVGPLVSTLGSRHQRVRVGAAGTLGEIGDQQAIVPLLSFLKSDDEDFRFSVACALTKLGDPRGVEALMPFLSHRDSSFRDTAVTALARSESEKAIDALISILDDTGVAGARAALALKHLTGVAFGRDQQLWRNWRQQRHR